MSLPSDRGAAVDRDHRRQQARTGHQPHPVGGREVRAAEDGGFGQPAGIRRRPEESAHSNSVQNSGSGRRQQRSGAGDHHGRGGGFQDRAVRTNEDDVVRVVRGRITQCGHVHPVRQGLRPGQQPRRRLRHRRTEAPVQQQDSYSFGPLADGARGYRGTQHVAHRCGGRLGPAAGRPVAAPSADPRSRPAPARAHPGATAPARAGPGRSSRRRPPAGPGARPGPAAHRPPPGWSRRRPHHAGPRGHRAVAAALRGRAGFRPAGPRWEHDCLSRPTA